MGKYGKKISLSNKDCIFVHQKIQLSLGYEMLFAARAVGNDPFSVLLADDFLANQQLSVTFDLTIQFSRTGKTQLALIRVISVDILKYGVVVPSFNRTGILGLIEKPLATRPLSN